MKSIILAITYFFALKAVFGVDTDNDGLTDGEEIQFGLDPNVPDTVLMAYINGLEDTARTDGNTTGVSWVLNNLTHYKLYTEGEKNASNLSQYNGGYAAGQIDGNITGVSWVLNNLSLYDLYSEGEKNASDLSQNNTGYTVGQIDGNSTGITWVLSNLTGYDLYTESEKNASNLSQYNSGYSNGFSEGNSTGISWVLNNLTHYDLHSEEEMNATGSTQYARGVEDIQTSPATGGLARPYDLLAVDIREPYTSQWFYQPGIGWLWTNRGTFPFIYRAEDSANSISAGWLYLNQWAGQDKINLYDYGTGAWIEMDF